MLGHGALGQLALGQMTDGPSSYVLGALTATYNIAAPSMKLTAVTGAFVISGVNASLRTSNLKMYVATAALNVAGHNATLFDGWALSAEAGSFAVTTFGSLWKQTLAAAPAALHVAGVNAGLGHLIAPLAIAGGAYTVTNGGVVFKVFFGVDPVPSAVSVVDSHGTSLFTTRFLRGSAGAVAVAASGAVLAHTRPFNAVAATFDLSGVVAGLQVARRLTARFGYYWAIGANAYPQKVGSLAFSPAAFVISGAADLKYGVTMQCATGALSISGSASLLRAYTLKITTLGWYLVTHRDADLRAHRIAGWGAVAYVVDGAGAILTNGKPFGTLNVGFAVSEYPVVLRRTRTLTARVGAFTLAPKNVYTHEASGAARFVWKISAVQAVWAPRAKVLKTRWLQ